MAKQRSGLDPVLTMTTHTKDRSTHSPRIPTGRYPSAPGAPREAARSSWRTTLRCRLRRKAIDRELAAGADTSLSECLRRRASELTGESSREDLAISYEHLLVGMTHTLPIGLAHVNWRAVRVATPLIDRLVKRLRGDSRVRAHGAARAKLLLAERGSALYGKDSRRLVDDVRSVLAAL